MPNNRASRAEALETKIREESRQAEIQPGSPQYKALIRTMLEIRIDEILEDTTRTKVEATNQAIEEYTKELEGQKDDTAKSQIEALNEARNKILESRETGEAPHTKSADEEEKKKKEKEKEKEEDKKKGEDDEATATSSGQQNMPHFVATHGSSTPTNTFRVNFGGAGSSSHYEPNRDPGTEMARVGRTKDATTIDLGGIRATVYKSGVHREMRIQLPDNPTKEQQARFDKAIATMSKYNEKSYGLLTHNCVGAVAETLSALRPKPKPGEPRLNDTSGTRMPWSLDSKVDSFCTAQRHHKIKERSDQYQQWRNEGNHAAVKHNAANPPDSNTQPSSKADEEHKFNPTPEFKPTPNGANG